MNNTQTQISGSFFHVYNRAPNGELVFPNSGSYIYFLQILKRNLKKYEISIITYCLMPNHFHLLVQLNKEFSLSPFIQHTLNSYVQGHNKFTFKKGPLFEGRTKYKLVEDEKNLLQVTRYIHLNPVKANLVRNPEEWLFSNYQEWLNLRNGTLKDDKFIQEHFSDIDLYREFVLTGINEERIPNINCYLMDNF